MISTSVKILQINLNKSSIATESALQLVIELKVDLVLVQEPWLVTRDPSKNWSSTRSVLHPSYTQILPIVQELRPRTLVYIARGFKHIVNLVPIVDLYILILDIIEGSQRLQLVNIYNKDSQIEGEPRTLERVLYNRAISPSIVLLGDFNTHYPQWDPLARKTQGANTLVEQIESKDLILLNTPGVGTFYRPNLARENTLDLTFASSSIASKVQDQQTLPRIGSDYHGLLYTILGSYNPSLVDSPLAQPRYNTRLADQELFQPSLKGYYRREPYY